MKKQFIRTWGSFLLKI